MSHANSTDARLVDVACAECHEPLEFADDPSGARHQCPKCGSTARIFRAVLTESVTADDSVHAEVIRLSADTSATAVMVMTTLGRPDGMKDFWQVASELREQMLRNHGSDQALRAIAAGAFDPAPQYPFDEPTKTIARFVAAETLHERQAAAERDRAAREELRDYWRTFGRRMGGFLKWLLRILKG